MQQGGDGIRLNEEQRLFLGVVEQLARPLVTVSRMSEFALANESATSDQWRVVQAVTDASLRLVESYALSLRIQGKLTPLTFEPVTVSSLLYDTAERLMPFAKQYGVEIELDAGPRAQPVMADRVVLQSAFESLGQVFVMAQAETDRRAYLRLGAHRSRHGVVAGCYASSTTLGVDSLRRARAMQGNARQPFQQLVNGPAAGVFVADSLLQTLEAHLHVARYHNMTGLAATLLPSQQLQLV
jgi:hypothetical protein